MPGSIGRRVRQPRRVGGDARKGRVPEQHIEVNVKQYGRETGWWVRKFSSPGHRGVPDDIFIKEGRVVFIEFKSNQGHLSRLQQVEIELLREAGAEVYVVDNINDGIDVLNGKVKPLLNWEWLS